MLEIDRRPAEVHYNLGLALANQGQLDEAALEYRLALESKPDHAEAHNNLGNVLLTGGQTDAAIAEYLRTLEVNPENAEAHYNLAVALTDAVDRPKPSTIIDGRWRSIPTIPRHGKVSTLC